MDEHRRTEDAAAQTRAADLRRLADGSGDLLARIGPKLDLRYASPASRALLGYHPQELVGRRILELVVADDRPALHAAAAQLAATDAAVVVCRASRSDGRTVWLESTVTAVRDRTGRLVELACVARDVTRRKAVEQRLAHQAMHDALTGLPNRTLFGDRLGHALSRRIRRGTGTLAVLFLDVDRFKVVNDSLGHEAGDRLLIAVAARLDTALRPADTVARFGGDEFAILCEDVAGELETAAIAQRVVDLFEEPFDIDGRELLLSTSVGIALAAGNPAHPPRAADLIRDADTAMYHAKDRGKARFELFDGVMRRHAARRHALERDLRRAVARDELRMHLQPELAVAGGGLIGFEALLRWQHPERGLLVPGDFIALAEETGLIGSIGEWILRRACATAARWSAPGSPGSAPTAARPGISVNVSARQLAQPGLTDVVTRALADSGLPPGCLRLELTEAAVIEHGAAAPATLDALKTVGVVLAIDDFGTGWSSLGHLRRLPLDVVKLDRSFVTGLGREPRDAAIAAAIVALAHALGLSTVAEGVETAEQLAVLAEIGCDAGQGFLFSGPAPEDAFAPLLRERGVS